MKSAGPAPATPADERRLVAQVRRDTRPELALRRELHRRGLRYRVHVRVLPGLRRESDIVFTRARIVVDVRGCWWHGCPDHRSLPQSNRDWWANKFAGNRLRDDDTVRRLTSAGWEVIVVWEHENVVESADRIEAAVKTGRTSSTMVTKATSSAGSVAGSSEHGEGGTGLKRVCNRLG